MPEIDCKCNNIKISRIWFTNDTCTIIGRSEGLYLTTKLWFKIGRMSYYAIGSMYVWKTLNANYKHLF